jgi:hypothetical protein
MRRNRRRPSLSGSPEFHRKKFAKIANDVVESGFRFDQAIDGKNCARAFKALNILVTDVARLEENMDSNNAAQFKQVDGARQVMAASSDEFAAVCVVGAPKERAIRKPMTFAMYSR